MKDLNFHYNDSFQGVSDNVDVSEGKITRQKKYFEISRIK